MEKNQMKNFFRLSALTLAISLVACSPVEEAPSNITQNVVDQNTQNDMAPSAPIDVSKDYHSYANPDEVLVTHLNLDLTADFSTKKLIVACK
jgi:leukotriene-A4 hydrolase